MTATEGKSRELSVPRISVIMTVRNGAAFLREAVTSIVAQTFEDFEFIIVNNGSTDATGEMLASFDDPRVKVITVPSENPPTFSEGISRAYRAARGDYVAVQDSDDVSLPQRIERQTVLLDAFPDVGLVGTWVEWIDERGGILGRDCPPADRTSLRDSYASTNPICHSTIMVRRSMADAVGGYDTRYRNGCDYALAMAMIEAGFGVSVIPEFLARIRVHPQQTMRAPDTVLARGDETLNLMMRAQRLPGLTDKALSKGRVAITKIRVDYGLNLLRFGAIGSAGAVFLAALGGHPLLAIAYAGYRTMKSFLPTRGRRHPSATSGLDMLRGAR